MAVIGAPFRTQAEIEEEENQRKKLLAGSIEKMFETVRVYQPTKDVTLDFERGTYERPAQQPFYMGLKKNRRKRN